MLVDVVAELLGQGMESSLERLVLEPAQPAAPVADGVVVVLSGRVGGLIAGGSVDVDAVHELEAREDVEGAVDGREADGVVAFAQLVVDRLGAAQAAL